MPDESQKGTVFSVETPLGFTVVVSHADWQAVVAKHPEIAERAADVALALSSPDEVRRSRRDKQVLLFYRLERVRRWVVAVATPRGLNGRLITAYRTDAIKEGTRIWPK
ncbi:MAG: hypothetical protein ACHQ4J_14860 [Candidatus Binatia bacterium]